MEFAIGQSGYGVLGSLDPEGFDTPSYMGSTGFIQSHCLTPSVTREERDAPMIKNLLNFFGPY